MKMKTVAVVTAALALTALPFFGSDALETADDVGTAGASVITGTVTESDTGRPLGGVRVWLDQRPEATLTNPAGVYRLTVDDPEMVGQDVMIRVDALGYQPVGETVRVSAGGVTRNFRLSPEALDEANEKVEGERRQDEDSRASADAPAPISQPLEDAARRVRGAPSLARSVVNMSAGSVMGRVAGFDPDFNTESYAHISENGFRTVADEPLSTFSIDVDRASYSNVRRFLTDGQRPPVDAVRIEEMVNYFKYDYPDARGRHPFSVTTDMTAAPWNPNHTLVRVGVQGRHIDLSDAPRSNLVFLLDVSGSMNSPDKLPLLKQAFRMLVSELRPDDRVAIVVYAGAAGLVLPSTPGRDVDTILDALAQLEAGGSTAGGAGIRLAYRIARENHIDGGNNRVILATDGDFNVGASSDSEMIRLIEEKRTQGTFLTVLGFGTGNLKDSKMEQIADHGNGNYAYIDGPLEARKVLVTEMGGTLLTIAKDVKIQVEFNPDRVAEYRLIGYENRLLANEDFNDDTKDAGELGAGHSVTALYEVVPAGRTSGADRSIDPLRYGRDSDGSRTATTAGSRGGELSNELMFVKLRYKSPEGDTSTLLSHAVVESDEEASTDLRFASAVAGFGMLLRDSEYAGDLSIRDVLRLAESGLGKDEHGYRSEFLRLVERVEKLELLELAPQ